jgi:hypothetical protein
MNIGSCPYLLGTEKMSELNTYILQHAIRQPRGTSKAAADVFFFEVVRSSDATGARLRTLIDAHTGVSNEVDVFDGQEHGYLELGGWLGDQGAALALIGLGSQLSLWKLLTPKTVLGTSVPFEIEESLAGQGLISLIAELAVDDCHTDASA